MPVTSGVPQGSVLGPILFIIYVNSLAQSLSSMWYSFADDYKLFVAYRGGSDGQSRLQLQRDLDDIFIISGSWNLKLNPSKCVVVRFGRGGSTLGCGSGYTLGDSELRFVNSHRDLGIVFDSDLKFHHHVDGIVRKAAGMANQLFKMCCVQGP